jgi:hypothetical protein
MQNQSGKAACALRQRPQYRGGCYRRCLKIRSLHWMEQFMTCLCHCLLMTLCWQTKCNYLARASWIDPDTPQQYHTTEPLAKGDKREFRLVRWSNPLVHRTDENRRKDWLGFASTRRCPVFVSARIDIADSLELQSILALMLISFGSVSFYVAGLLRRVQSGRSNVCRRTRSSLECYKQK